MRKLCVLAIVLAAMAAFTWAQAVESTPAPPKPAAGRHHSSTHRHSNRGSSTHSKAHRHHQHSTHHRTSHPSPAGAPAQ